MLKKISFMLLSLILVGLTLAGSKYFTDMGTQSWYPAADKTPLTPAGLCVSGRLVIYLCHAADCRIPDFVLPGRKQHSDFVCHAAVIAGFVVHDFFYHAKCLDGAVGYPDAGRHRFSDAHAAEKTRHSLSAAALFLFCLAAVCHIFKPWVYLLIPMRRKSVIFCKKKYRQALVFVLF